MFHLRWLDGFIQKKKSILSVNSNLQTGSDFRLLASRCLTVNQGISHVVHSSLKKTKAHQSYLTEYFTVREQKHSHKWSQTWRQGLYILQNGSCDLVLTTQPRWMSLQATSPQEVSLTRAGVKSMVPHRGKSLSHSNKRNWLVTIYIYI